MELPGYISRCLEGLAPAFSWLQSDTIAIQRINHVTVSAEMELHARTETSEWQNCTCRLLDDALTWETYSPPEGFEATYIWRSASEYVVSVLAAIAGVIAENGKSVDDVVMVKELLSGCVTELVLDVRSRYVESFHAACFDDAESLKLLDDAFRYYAYKACRHRFPKILTGALGTFSVRVGSGIPEPDTAVSKSVEPGRGIGATKRSREWKKPKPEVLGAAVTVRVGIAAEALGKCTRQIYRLVKSGHLQSVTNKGTTRINSESARAYLEERRIAQKKKK